MSTSYGGGRGGAIVSPGDGGGLDPTQPLAPLPTGYLEGFRATWLTASTVQIGIGRGRNIADDFDVELTAAQTADITASGVNGLDTGVEAANTWYYVWVIGDSNGVNPGRLLISLSTTEAGLTYPAGYDRARMVLSIRNNPSSNIREFFQQTFSGQNRRIAWDEQTYANMQVLSGFSSLVYTNVVCTGFMPPTTDMVWLNVRGDSSSGLDSKAYLRPDGSGTANNVTQLEMFGGDSGYAWQRVVASIFEVAVGSLLTTVDIAVLGYDDWLIA